MTDPTPVSLPVWGSMVADYGDPLVDMDDDPQPIPLKHRPPVPAPPAEAATVTLPAARPGSTALTARETP